MTDIHGQSKSIKPVLFWAEMYLAQQRKEWPHHKLAVVFDIDDTAIPVQTQKVTPEFKQVYDIARKNNYYVFFVTARVEEGGNGAATLRQLKQSGFDHIDGLFMMPVEHLHAQNFSLYKFEAREQIHRSGYNIVLNAGDGWHDLMLLPPYQPDAQKAKQVAAIVQTLSNRDYIILRPPDVAWMGIKFPEVHD